MDIVNNDLTSLPVTPQPEPKELTLPSGRIAKIRPSFVDDAVIAYEIVGSKAGNMYAILAAIIALTCEIDGQRYIYEDIGRCLSTADFFILMGEVLGGKPLPSVPPSGDASSLSLRGN